MGEQQRIDPLELMTLDEIARLTKRSRRTLYSDIAAGRLHAVQLGRQTRVPRQSVMEFVYGNGNNCEHGK
jgi:excisionase family DNA binding protein